MKDELIELLQSVGDNIAEVIIQMLKGEWVDSENHDVEQNIAMIKLANSLKNIGDFRSKHLGYSEFTIQET